jgi:hypothetical protein
MLTLAATAIAVLTKRLPALVPGIAPFSDDAAATALNTLITMAFRALGEESTWADFLADPADAEHVTSRLATALERDAGLARRIERTVKIMTDNSYTSSNQTGARGRNIAGRDLHNTRNTYGGALAVVAVVIVAVFAIWAGHAVYTAVRNDGLTKDSTCADFLKASQEDELTAIRTVGMDEGVAGVGSPLALPAISYACSGRPDAKLGDVIVRFKGQF